MPRGLECWHGGHDLHFITFSCYHDYPGLERRETWATRQGLTSCMPTSRPPIITQMCTGNCESRVHLSPPTTCGSQLWCCSIRSPSTTAMRISMHFPKSRASRKRSGSRHRILLCFTQARNPRDPGLPVQSEKGLGAVIGCRSRKTRAQPRSGGMVLGGCVRGCYKALPSLRDSDKISHSTHRSAFGCVVG
jgi:hypothetical protein